MFLSSPIFGGLGRILRDSGSFAVFCRGTVDKQAKAVFLIQCYGTNGAVVL